MVVFVVKLVVKLGGKRFRIVTWPDNQMGNMQLDHKKRIQIRIRFNFVLHAYACTITDPDGKRKKIVGTISWEQNMPRSTFIYYLLIAILISSATVSAITTSPITASTAISAAAATTTVATAATTTSITPSIIGHTIWIRSEE